MLSGRRVRLCDYASFSLNFTNIAMMKEKANVIGGNGEIVLLCQV